MSELSAEQERARTKFLSWYRSPHKARQWFFLTGSAGVGKSYTCKAMIDGLPGKIILAGPTGKSAVVLQRATGRPAQTIHSLIYRPQGTGGDRVKIEKMQAELNTLEIGSIKAKQLDVELKKLLSGVKPLFSLNLDSQLRDAALLVVDEASMLSEETCNDLLSFNVPMLIMGDPYQLAPVMSKPFFKVEQADVCLTEIHRQAKDSPIIHLATLARQGKKLPVGIYGDSKVTRDVSTEEAMAHDQIIVGKNETRHATNRKVRELLGRDGPMPEPGDKLMCVHNDAKAGLMNGGKFICTSFDSISDTKCILGIDGDVVGRVTAHKDYFLEKEPDPWQKSKANCFTHAWVCTAHKMQGDQEKACFVLDQSRIFRGQSANWLYTAITRSSERVTVKLT
jgi:exodeoxyribonuclease-5